MVSFEIEGSMNKIVDDIGVDITCMGQNGLNEQYLDSSDQSNGKWVQVGEIN